MEPAVEPPGPRWDFHNKIKLKLKMEVREVVVVVATVAGLPALLAGFR